MLILDVGQPLFALGLDIGIIRIFYLLPQVFRFFLKHIVLFFQIIDFKIDSV